LQVLPDSGSWRAARASIDASVVDPAGQEVWRRNNIRGGDPFSFPANGPRVRADQGQVIAFVKEPIVFRMSSCNLSSPSGAFVIYCIM
jgi:hypothetical protein